MGIYSVLPSIIVELLSKNIIEIYMITTKMWPLAHSGAAALDNASYVRSH
jgi:hypothetical protein